jgi:putative membrane protein
MSHAHESAGWDLDAWVVVPLALAISIYGIGLVTLRRRSLSEQWHRLTPALAYFAGCLTLILALVSPAHALAEQLFTWHMIEHEIIMAVAAPLLVVGHPIGLLLWGVPRALRLWLTRAARHEAVQCFWTWLIRPINATLIHGVAIWAWHLPVLFEAAVTHPLWHRLQHVCFLVSALLFWYSMLRRSSRGEAIWHLFFTMLHTSLLGALLAVAPRVLYVAQTAHSLAWGLTPLEDQQLAGIFMWVPAGTVYAGAALYCAARWIRPAGTDGTYRRRLVR